MSFGVLAVSFHPSPFRPVVQIRDADKLAHILEGRPQWPKGEINTRLPGPLLLGIYRTVDCYLVRVRANN